MIWLLALVPIGALMLVVWWRWYRFPRLRPLAAKRIRDQWNRALSRTDHHRAIMEADAIVSTLLGQMGFRGTMADRLRKARGLLPDEQEVWNAHKLRNRIAHEPDTNVRPDEAKRALAAFGKVIRKFCGNAT